MIHPHKVLHGDRKAALELVPFAKHKMKQLRKFVDRKNLSSFHQRHAAPDGGSVLLICTRTESIIHIWSGGRDGYYSLGTLVDDFSDGFHISGSRTARGMFSDRGVFGRGAFGVPNLFYVGEGFGVVPDFSTFGATTYFRTRDGRQFTPVVAFTYDMDLRTNLAASVLVTGGRGVSEEPFLEISYGTLVRGYFESTDEYAAVYIYTLDNGVSWRQVETGYGPQVEVGQGMVRRVGPRALIKYIPAYATVRNQRTRGMSYFGVSNDNGASWTFPGGNDFLSDLEATTGGLTTATYNHRVGIAGLRMVVRRLATGDTMMATWWLGDDFREDIRVYRAPGMGASFSRVATIPDTQVIPAVDQELNSEFCQGVPLIQPFLRVGTDPAVFFVGSEDATTWTLRTLPWMAYHVGYIRAINRTTLVLPVFNIENGHYELYESDDLGETWEFRATIRTDAVFSTPSNLNTTSLSRFGLLSILRQNGQSAPTFPGQPWVGDYRVIPPWEA